MPLIAEYLLRRRCQARLFAVLRSWRQRELDHWRLELPRTPYRIRLERSRISFSCAQKDRQFDPRLSSPCGVQAFCLEKGHQKVIGLQFEGTLLCAVLMWQFHNSIFSWWYKTHDVLFFWWYKKHDVFFFVWGRTDFVPLLAKRQPTNQSKRPVDVSQAAHAGGAGAGAAISGAMEPEKSEKPRKKSKWDQADEVGRGGKHTKRGFGTWLSGGCMDKKKGWRAWNLKWIGLNFVEYYDINI